MSVFGKVNISNRTTAVVRSHIRCCADAHQVLCSKKYREEDKWYFYGNVWRDMWMGDRFRILYKRKKRFQINGNAIGTPLGIRTLDPLIKSQLLYQLS